MPQIKKQIDDQERRIRRLLARAEPEIRAAYLSLLDRQIDALPLDEIERLLLQGQPGQLLAAISQPTDDFSVFITGVYVAAGVETATFLSQELGQFISFDQVNTRAVNAARAMQLRLVQNLNAEQRRASLSAIEDGIARGLNPRDAARNFRASIGLTEYQQRNVQNYRRQLEEGQLSSALRRELRDKRFDRSLLRAIRQNRDLTPEQIDRFVERYRQNYVNFRAETIARTEALSAVHEGADELYMQALERGVLEQGQLVRVWRTAADARVRDSHQTMNGQEREIGETFVTGRGALLMRPGDINAPASETVQCRCAVGLRLRRRSRS